MSADNEWPECYCCGAASDCNCTVLQCPFSNDCIECCEHDDCKEVE
jgi:hypothetical protein